jgi:hypothetical protein
LMIEPVALFKKVMNDMDPKAMVTRHFVTKLIENLDLLPVPEHEDGTTNDEW